YPSENEFVDLVARSLAAAVQTAQLPPRPAEATKLLTTIACEIYRRELPPPPPAIPHFPTTSDEQSFQSTLRIFADRAQKFDHQLIAESVARSFYAFLQQLSGQTN